MNVLNALTLLSKILKEISPSKDICFLFVIWIFLSLFNISSSFILNVWPQIFLTDFVAKQIGVACYLPFTEQSKRLIQLGKAESSGRF